MSDRCQRIQLQVTDPRYQPTKAHPDDAGYDIKARIERSSVGIQMIVPAGEARLIPCGFRMALPVGYEAQIRSRSGLALKQGLMVLNSPGTIDCGYRGEVGVILHNTGEYDYTVQDGDRIAQMVICKLPTVGFDLVDQLDETQRGDGGFGSTGVRAVA